MSEIMIKCPDTGKEISTGIECDGTTFRHLPVIVTQTDCPLCGGRHAWSKSEAWLSEATKLVAAAGLT